MERITSIQPWIRSKMIPCVQSKEFQSICPYTDRLVDLLSQRKGCQKSFNFYLMPNHSEKKDYEIYSQDGVLEIVCFKSTFISIFKECHSLLRKLCPDVTNYNKDTYLKDEQSYQLIYKSTIGLLLTSAENHKNFNLHEDIFFAIWDHLTSQDSQVEFLLNETSIIQALLMTSINKVNKSSSLNTWYKRLFVLWNYIDPEVKNIEGHTMLYDQNVFLRSGAQHFANYYTWNASRWVFDNIPHYEYKLSFFNDVKLFCFENLSDVSSWNALAYMVCQMKTQNKHNIGDYNRLYDSLELHITKKENMDERTIVWLDLDISNLVQDLLKKISSSKIKVWPPYLCILQILITYPQELQEVKDGVVRNWTKQIQEFESKNGEIVLYHRFTPITPIEKQLEDKDYLTTEEMFHLGHKKVFLNKLNQY